MKYYILFTEKTTTKVTNVKNNYIIKIKIINKIQHTKIYKNYVALLYIYLFSFDASNVLLSV